MHLAAALIGQVWLQLLLPCALLHVSWQVSDAEMIQAPAGCRVPLAGWVILPLALLAPGPLSYPDKH